jgi:hypothetical protein
MYYLFTEDAKAFGIVDAAITPDEIVVLTGNFRFLVITDFEEPRPKFMPDLGLNNIPDAWEVVPGKLSLSGHLEIYCSFKRKLFLVDMMKAEDQRVDRGTIYRISLSPNGKLLAFYSSEKQLSVVTSDFQNIVAEFKTNSEDPPIVVAW